jgi:VWFA-related protein
VNRLGALAVAALLLSPALVLTARQDKQPVPRFQSGVDLIAVDVSVLDRDRRPVRGLTAADFTILEDDRPQPVSAFFAINLPDVEEAIGSATWMRTVAADVQRNADFKDRRIVIIAMDDATPMPAAEIPRAKDLARRTIESLGPNEIAAVVYAFNKSAGQEFTRDRSRLLAAVDRFNGGIPLAAFDSFDVKALSMYLAAVDTLRGVADYLVDLPDRRKALVWVSVGVPIDWEMAQAGMISLTDPGSATRSGDMQAVIRSASQLLASAQRANVTIYGLDPGGLRAPAPSTDALTGTTTMSVNPGKLNIDFLSGISAGTGGFAVVDTNDPVQGIRQVLRENASYYLLGYVSPNRRTQGRFHRVDVRVNRPDVTVRARNGYYEPTSAGRKKPAAPSPAVDRALAGPIPKTDLEMQVSAVPFALPGDKRAAIAVVLGVRQNAPTRATRLVNNVDLRAAAFSPDGRQRASSRKSVPVTLNTPGFGSTIGYELMLRLELAPGRYQLRVAAETSMHGIQLGPRAPEVSLLPPDADTSGKSGSVYCDLDVPDFANAALSLSGVVLSVTPAVASGPKDALASIMPVVPTTLREFTSDDHLTAFVRAYQGGKDALVATRLDVRIVDGQDAKVFETTETLTADRFAKERAAEYSLEVPIGTLKSGPHLLTIEAKAGGKTARRDVRFEVR